MSDPGTGKQMNELEAGRLLGDVTVSYTVRELLGRIEEKVTRLDQKFETVATQSQVKALEVKVDNLGAEVDTLKSHRDRVLGFAIGLSLAAGGGAGWIANLLSNS